MNLKIQKCKLFYLIIDNKILYIVENINKIFNLQMVYVKIDNYNMK